MTATSRTIRLIAPAAALVVAAAMPLAREQKSAPGKLTPPFDPSQFIQAKVCRNPPEECRKFRAVLEILPLGVDSREGFLRHVLRLVVVRKHSDAQTLDRLLPARDQLCKGLGIIVHLHAPHRLLICHAKPG